MVKDYVTVKETAEILDIYEVSAKELLEGLIEFEADELWQIAAAKGISLDELIR